MTLPFWGRASAVSIDPVEKKPLYHFMPGTRTYSAGYLGCNLKCPFCQNSSISQTNKAQTVELDAVTLAIAAAEASCPSISHTYSEPLVHAEFVHAAMEKAHDAGLYNILVTNGMSLEPASRMVLKHCDAVNVDLKCWDASFYSKELGGDLDTVLAFIRLAYELGVHMEITTLIIPGKNDDDAQINEICKFIVSLSPEIPLHLSAYHPMYKYTIPGTPWQTMERLATAAQKHLHYVYVGNVSMGSNNTACHFCGQVLIERQGYAIRAVGIENGVCSHCHKKSPIVFKPNIHR